MMKTKRIYRRVLSALFAGICTLQVNAQAVKYTYDGSGNRETRSKVIVMRSMLKSAGADAETEDEAAEPDQSAKPDKSTGPSKFEEMLTETKITVYPNPTKGVLRVEITGKEIPKDAKMMLYGISGTLIRQWTAVSGSNVMDISAQPAGTYIMRIMLDKENVSVWKVIKE